MPIKWSSTPQRHLLQQIKKSCGNLFSRIKIADVDIEDKLLRYKIKRRTKPDIEIEVALQNSCIAKTIFNSSKAELSSIYKSLLNFSYVEWSSEEDIVSFTIENMVGRYFVFTKKIKVTSKMNDEISSLITLVKEALEFIINAEMGIILSHCALKDAQSRNREDLVAVYTNQMSELVKITSYDNIIKNLDK